MRAHVRTRSLTYFSRIRLIQQNLVIRVILALTRLHRLGALRGSQGLAEGQAWHLLISFSGLQPFLPHRFVSCLRRLLPTSLPYRPLPSTPCDSCSACLLPTVHLGNTASHWQKSIKLAEFSRIWSKRWILSVKCFTKTFLL